MAKTTKDVQNKAAKMYESIRNRGRSRFLKNGIDESLSILVSSSTYSSSFTEQRIRKAVNDPTIYVIDGKLWEVKPKGTYSNEKFQVFVGNDYLDPFVVESVADVNNVRDSLQLPRGDFKTIREAIDSIQDPIFRAMFLDIPIDFKKSFDGDIVTSIQDIAGYPIAPLGRLFSSKKHYNAAIDPKQEHPFIQDEITISTGSETQVKDFIRSDWRPMNTDKKRYIHIDQSLSGDSTGIGCSYVDHIEEVDGVPTPCVRVEWMLRINPPKPPYKIDIGKVRGFIIWYARHFQLDIGLITYDWAFSQESTQVLEAEGFNVGYQSVDKTDDAYVTFCNLLYEYRVQMYRYPRFEKELFELIHYREKKKVDHPATGTKDVADGVVGSVMNALTDQSVTDIQLEGDIDILLKF